MEKQKLGRAVLIAMIVLGVLRVWFGGKVGGWYMCPGPHDDQWCMRVANLPAYFHQSLDMGTKVAIKELMFPLFLAFVHVTGIKFSMVVSALYVIAAALTVYLVRLCTPKKSLALLAYTFILWCPIGFNASFTRIYRNCILGPFILIVFLMAMIYFFKMIQDKQLSASWYIKWGLVFGIVFSFTAYIKEDGAWLVACLLAFMCLNCIVLVVRLKKMWKKCAKMMFVVCIPLLVYFVFTAGYKGVNYHYFGVYATNTRTSSELGEFVNNIYKIQSDDRTETVWAPADAIEQAFQASETLSKEPELLYAIIHTGWYDGDIYKNPIQGDFLSWVLRDALSAAGLWGDYAETEELFKKVNDELDNAFDEGTLKKDNKFRIVSSTGGRSAEEIWNLKAGIKDIYKNAILLKGCKPGAIIMDLQEYDSEYEAYITNEQFNYTDNALSLREKEVNWVNDVINILFKVYAVVQILLIILGTVASIVCLVRIIMKKSKNTLNVAMLLMGIGLAGISIAYAFCIAWFCSFLSEWSLLFYSVPVASILYLTEVCGAIMFWNMLPVDWMKKNQNKNNTTLCDG